MMGLYRSLFGGYGSSTANPSPSPYWGTDPYCGVRLQNQSSAGVYISGPYEVTVADDKQVVILKGKYDMTVEIEVNTPEDLAALRKLANLRLRTETVQVPKTTLVLEDE